MDSERKYADFKQLCMEHGFKCTQQRYAVYRCMNGNRKHPDVDQVWRQVKKELPSITRESVFRILNELADSGTAYRLDKISSARFDGNPDSHGHLICEKCGSITDFELPGSLLRQPAPDGFHTDHVELRVCGICEKCAARKNGGAKPR